MTKKRLKREVKAILKKASKEKSQKEVEEIVTRFGWMKGTSPNQAPVFVGPSCSLHLVEEPEDNQDNNGQGEDVPSDIIPSISAEDDTSEAIAIPEVSTEDADSDVIILHPVTSPDESEDEAAPVTFDLVTGKVQFKLTKR